MFGNLIYYNKKKIDQYSTLITGRNVERKEDKADTLVNQVSDYLLECSEFEKILQQREDYIDFVEGKQDITITEVKMSSIIRVTGEIYVPEQFDMIHLIEEYKPQILSGIDLSLIHIFFLHCQAVWIPQ